MQDFRRLMLEAVRESGCDSDVAVCLSGGIDSTCVMLACLDAGLGVTAYTFHLEGVRSQDSVAARAICEDLGLGIVDVEVPSSIESLKADVKRIVRTYGTARKTAVQCLQPFLYLADAIRETDVFSGLYADDLWGTSRKGNVAGHSGMAEFVRYRRSQLALEDYSCRHIQTLMERHGKRLHLPFVSDGVREYLLSLDWKAMNSPKPKYLAVRAYADYYGSHGWYRRNSNLQVNSGIREHHDRLLGTDWNTRGLRSVTGIYNDVLAGRIG